MKKNAHIVLHPDGRVRQAEADACSLMGLTAELLIDTPLVDQMLPDHRLRFESELEALVAREEDHGRVSCTVVGLDGIGRRLTLRMVRRDDDSIHVSLSLAASSAPSEHGDEGAVLGSERLLPLARRISTICRRSTNREELLTHALSALAEVTHARGAAAIAWTGMKTGKAAVLIGDVFDEAVLVRVFRPGVTARLARGDVIVMESGLPNADTSSSFLLIPLMGTDVPEGVIVLAVEGYAVLAPREQQSLGIMGEIIGLGLRALTVTLEPATRQLRGSSDEEAAIALGRLSAGLAHEINNAATVLKSNAEQSLGVLSAFGHGSKRHLAAKDSIDAVETIRNLTEILRAFAPEETTELEDVDLLQVLTMVLASVRFYAKRGVNVTVDSGEGEAFIGKCRSHYLTRSLLIIFVELVEAALASGRELDSAIGLDREGGEIRLAIRVTSGALNVPAVLLTQMSGGGVLERHVRRSGARLSHELEGGNLSLFIALPAAKGADGRSLPPLEATRPNRRGTILIVDDEPAIVRSIRRLLEPDHDVLAARSGAEALSILRANDQIDAVLLDVLMPEMNGPQVHQEIQRFSPAAAERVVFITGGATIPEVSAYLASSESPLLDKPIDTQRLFSVLAEMIK